MQYRVGGANEKNMLIVAKKQAAYFQTASALGGATSSLTHISRRKPPKHRQRTSRPKTARSTPCAVGGTLVSSVKDTRAATSSMSEPRLAPVRSRRPCPLFCASAKKIRIPHFAINQDRDYETAGRFTGLSGGRPCRTSATLRAQVRRACLRLSTVPPPMCGLNTTFLCARRPG